MSEHAPLNAAELTEAWAQLQKAPQQWLEKNLLIIVGASNSPEPNTVECFFSGELKRVTGGAAGSLAPKYRLAGSGGGDSIQVRVHRFAMMTAPAQKYRPPAGAAGAHAKSTLPGGIALTGTANREQALVITGQLSGCTVAVGGDRTHTVVTHVQPVGGYQNDSVGLQRDIQAHGEIGWVEGTAHKTTPVTNTFGRENYATGYATVVGHFQGGRWTFYAQKYANVQEVHPHYDVVSFAADMHVR